MTEPFYGPVREWVARIAKRAGIELEELPADSREAPAWKRVHIRIHRTALPLSGIQAMERAGQGRWAGILEEGRIRILPRKDAIAFWENWWAEERSK